MKMTQFTNSIEFLILLSLFIAGVLYGRKSLYLFCSNALFAFSEDAMLTLMLNQLLGTESLFNVTFPLPSRIAVPSPSVSSVMYVGSRGILLTT